MMTTLAKEKYYGLRTNNRYLDSYYVVVYKQGRSRVVHNSNDELIQTGFKSYEAGLDFIQVLQKLKGV